MVTLLTSIHIFVSVLLIIIVLLQQGKGSEMGAGLGGGSNQSLFGARGAATLLSKITTGAAVTFMCTSLALAYISSKDSSRSLLKDEGAQSAPTTGTPVVGSPTPVASVTPTQPGNSTTPPATAKPDASSPKKSGGK